MSHPVVTPKTYLVVFLALQALTGLTVSLPHLVQLGHLDVPVALAIASAKALLVIMIFMHLWYSPKLNWLSMIGAVLFLAILISLTMADYLTRSWLPEESVPGAVETSSVRGPLGQK